MASPQFFGDRAIAMPLGTGDAGTAQTIAHMRQLIHAGVKSPYVNRTAIAAVWNTPQFSQTQKAAAIFQFVQQYFRFMSDMVGPLGGIETLRTADETLRVRAGDCDDFSILIPALLGTIGIKSRIVTIAHHADDPEEFSHVYPEAFVDGNWIAMDVARPQALFGRSPETYFRKKVWNIYDNSAQEISGLSGYVGMGRFRRGLGQGDTFAEALAAAPALETGAANIILASNALPQNIVGTVNTGQYSAGGVPAGYTLTASGLVPSSTILAGMSPWILILGGIAVVLMLTRR